jgi:hypothetical protein
LNQDLSISASPLWSLCAVGRFPDKSFVCFVAFFCAPAFFCALRRGSIGIISALRPASSTSGVGPCTLRRLGVDSDCAVVVCCSVCAVWRSGSSVAGDASKTSKSSGAFCESYRRNRSVMTESNTSGSHLLIRSHASGVRCPANFDFLIFWPVTVSRSLQFRHRFQPPPSAFCHSHPRGAGGREEDRSSSLLAPVSCCFVGCSPGSDEAIVLGHSPGRRVIDCNSKIARHRRTP